MDPRRRTIALLALTLGVFLVTLNVTIVVVALLEIARDLDAGADTTAWIIDAYNLVGASLLLSAWYFADRFGRRRMLVTGYVLSAGGAVVCAIAPNVGWLLAFRVVQAIGGTAQVAMLRVVPSSRSAVARKLDVAGQVLAVVLLASLTFALIGATRFGWTSPQILAILAADVVLAFAFLRVEARTAEPLLDLRFCRDRHAYLLLGAGHGVLNAPLSTVAVASMPAEQSGVAADVVSSGRNVEIVLRIAALGSLVAARLPEPATVRGFADALTPAYLVAAGVLLAAIEPSSVATPDPRIAARSTRRWCRVAVARRTGGDRAGQARAATRAAPRYFPHADRQHRPGVLGSALPRGVHAVAARSVAAGGAHPRSAARGGQPHARAGLRLDGRDAGVRRGRLGRARGRLQQ